MVNNRAKNLQTDMICKKDFGLCFQSLLRFMDVVLQKI